MLSINKKNQVDNVNSFLFIYLFFKSNSKWRRIDFWDIRGTGISCFGYQLGYASNSFNSVALGQTPD